MIGVPSTNKMSPVNTTPSDGTWTMMSPRVCAGPTSINSTEPEGLPSTYQTLFGQLAEHGVCELGDGTPHTGRCGPPDGL
jgi:hypothetical protein